MRCSSLTLRTAFAVFGLVVSAAWFLLPEPVESAEPSKQAAAEQQPAPSGRAAIEEALGEKFTAKVVELPLHEVIWLLSEEFEINIVLDRQGLLAVGIAADQPVTFSVTDVPLRSVLDSLQRKFGLEWFIRDDMLLIGSRWSRSLPSTKVYRVDDLVAGYADDERARRQAESLKEIITRCVLPQSWQDDSDSQTATVAPLGDGVVLVVNGKPRSHEKVAAMLTELRKLASAHAGKTPTTVEQPKGTIERAFVSTVSVDFDKVPLKEALQRLEDQCGIPIKLDHEALEEEVIDSDHVITKKLTGISLRSVLRLMLRDLNCTYVIRDEVLWITTPEAAYDTEPESPRFVLRTYPVADVVGSHDGSGNVTERLNTLADLIRAYIWPTTWRHVGGPGALYVADVEGANALLVLQEPEVHEEVAALLAILRKLARDTAVGKPASRYSCYPEPSAAEKAIQKAMDQRVTMDFKETPLHEVARWLSESQKINILLDEKGLDQIGVGTDTPITFSVREISLHSALKLLLRELDLTYHIQDEVLMLTTREESESRILFALYPVGDLVGRRDESGRVTYEFSWLIDLIVSIVGPTTWDEVGGPGSIVPIQFDNVQALAVSQDPDTDEELCAFLLGLRKLAHAAAEGDASREAWRCGQTPADVATEKAINAALDKKVFLEFRKTPLTDVVAHLRQLANINIMVDRRELDNLGIRVDAPVSLHVYSMSLRSALDLLLDQLGLGWQIHDEVLWVTAAHRLQHRFATKLYPVADLVVCRDRSGQPWDDYRTLIDIVYTIQPRSWGWYDGQSWDRRGGLGHGRGVSVGEAKILIVSQAEPVHREIARLLKELRDARKPAADGKPPLREKPPPEVESEPLF